MGLTCCSFVSMVIPSVQLTSHEPRSHISLMGRVFYLDPLVVHADLFLAARFSNGEFMIDRHTFDQRGIADHWLIAQRHGFRGGLHFDGAGSCGGSGTRRP